MDYDIGNVGTHVLALPEPLISDIDRKIRFTKSIGYRVVVI